MSTFRVKVYIENHPHSRDIINKFRPHLFQGPSRARFYNNNSPPRKKRGKTSVEKKETKRIFSSSLFILPWKMMEVRDGVNVVLLNFLSLLSLDKKKAASKKNEKFASFFSFSMKIQWAIWKGKTEKRSREKDGEERKKFTMWIKLCFLVCIEYVNLTPKRRAIDGWHCEVLEGKSPVRWKRKFPFRSSFRA